MKSIYVDNEAIKELYAQGWCIKCVNKYLEKDGALEVMNMCDKCKDLVLMQILKGE